MPIFRVTRHQLPVLATVAIAGVSYALPAGSPVRVVAPSAEAVRAACKGYRVDVRQLEEPQALQEAPSAPQDAPEPEEAPAPAPEAVEPAQPSRRSRRAPPAEPPAEG